MRIVTAGALAASSLLLACNNGEREGEAFTSSSIWPDACSEVDVTEGSSEWRTLLPDDSQRDEPLHGITPTGVAAAGGGSLYLVDPVENRLSLIDSTGAIRRQWGKKGDGPGEFRGSSTLALSRDGLVYVGSRGRITVFDSTGRLKRTIRTRLRSPVADFAVLPNGNIVVASEPWPGERPGAPYVVILSPDGRQLRDVLRTTKWSPRPVRPLLVPMANPLRVSADGNGMFAVWYSIDNYAQVFDSAGTRVGLVEGCLSRTISDFYGRAAQANARMTTYYPITLGTALIDNKLIVVSQHYRNKVSSLRVRRYGLDGTEITARDYDVSRHPHFSLVIALNDSSWIAFAPHSERGIGILTLH